MYLIQGLRSRSGVHAPCSYTLLSPTMSCGLDGGDPPTVKSESSPNFQDAFTHTVGLNSLSWRLALLVGARGRQMNKRRTAVEKGPQGQVHRLCLTSCLGEVGQIYLETNSLPVKSRFAPWCEHCHRTLRSASGDLQMGHQGNEARLVLREH